MSATTSSAEIPYKVTIVGTEDVGKTAMAVQFLAFEYFHDMDKRKRKTLSLSSINAKNLELKKITLQELEYGISVFNVDPRQGIQYLLSQDVIHAEDKEDLPDAVANFLFKTKSLDAAKVGEYISDAKNEKILARFISKYEYSSMRFAEAMRKTFSSNFTLPADPYAIDRLLTAFANEYHKQHQPALLALDTRQIPDSPGSSSSSSSSSSPSPSFRRKSIVAHGSAATATSSRPRSRLFSQYVYDTVPTSEASQTNLLAPKLVNKRKSVYIDKYFPLATSQAYYVLAYSIMLLNTDATSKLVKEKMTKKQFVEQLVNNEEFMKGVELPQAEEESFTEDLFNIGGNIHMGSSLLQEDEEERQANKAAKAKHKRMIQAVTPFLSNIYDEITKTPINFPTKKGKKKVLKKQFSRGSMVKDCYTRQVSLYNNIVTVHIIDDIVPAGQKEFFSHLEDLYLRQGDAFIVMYSVTDRESFASVPEYVEKITRIRSDPRDKAIIVLCGNKADLAEQRVVSIEEGEELARKLDLPFFETSTDNFPNTSKTAHIQHVSIVFMDLLRRVYHKKHAQAKGIQLHTEFSGEETEIEAATTRSSRNRGSSGKTSILKGIKCNIL